MPVGRIGKGLGLVVVAQHVGDARQVVVHPHQVAVIGRRECEHPVAQHDELVARFQQQPVGCEAGCALAGDEHLQREVRRMVLPRKMCCFVHHRQGVGAAVGGTVREGDRPAQQKRRPMALSVAFGDPAHMSLGQRLQRMLAVERTGPAVHVLSSRLARAGVDGRDQCLRCLQLLALGLVGQTEVAHQPPLATQQQHSPAGASFDARRHAGHMIETQGRQAVDDFVRHALATGLQGARFAAQPQAEPVQAGQRPGAAGQGGAFVEEGQTAGPVAGRDGPMCVLVQLKQPVQLGLVQLGLARTLRRQRGHGRRQQALHHSEGGSRTHGHGSESGPRSWAADLRRPTAWSHSDRDRWGSRAASNSLAMGGRGTTAVERLRLWRPGSPTAWADAPGARRSDASARGIGNEDPAGAFAVADGQATLPART
jgi:hypothetical protein